MSETISMRLLVSRSGTGFSQSCGETHSFSEREACQLFAAGQAVPADAEAEAAINAASEGGPVEPSVGQAEAPADVGQADKIDASVESLDVAAGVIRSLKRANLSTVGQVAEYGKAHAGDFSGIKGIGSAGSDQLGEALAKLTE